MKYAISLSVSLWASLLFCKPFSMNKLFNHCCMIKETIMASQPTDPAAVRTAITNYLKAVGSDEARQLLYDLEEGDFRILYRQSTIQ